MVRSVVALGLILLPAFLYASDTAQRERSFVRALDLFDSSKKSDDYREAAQVLESILADGYRSGAVYFNLGNAYFRAGEYGRAILNYRKAQPYRPRDPYLKANLRQAIAAAPGRLAEPPQPWWSHVFFWTEWLAFPTKVSVCGCGVCAAALMMLMAIYFRQPRFNWLALATIVFSAMIGAEIGLNNVEAKNNGRAVITTEAVARKGTGNSYEPAFDQPLRDGAEFRVLSETGDWTLGRFEGIGDGWVRNDSVAR